MAAIARYARRVMNCSPGRTAGESGRGGGDAGAGVVVPDGSRARSKIDGACEGHGSRRDEFPGVYDDGHRALNR
jgi:hypothetical protein